MAHDTTDNDEQRASQLVESMRTLGMAAGISEDRKTVLMLLNGDLGNALIFQRFSAAEATTLGNLLIASAALVKSAE